MKKILLILNLLMLISSCDQTEHSRFYSCGEMIPAQYNIPDLADKHSQCRALDFTGFCIDKRICFTGKWVAVQTGPWYQYDCGEEK